VCFIDGVLCAVRRAAAGCSDCLTCPVHFVYSCIVFSRGRRARTHTQFVRTTQLCGEYRVNSKNGAVDAVKFVKPSGILYDEKTAKLCRIRKLLL
jgi:hypothetical protein